MLKVVRLEHRRDRGSVPVLEGAMYDVRMSCIDVVRTNPRSPGRATSPDPDAELVGCCRRSKSTYELLSTTELTVGTVSDGRRARVFTKVIREPGRVGLNHKCEPVFRLQLAQSARESLEYGLNSTRRSPTEARLDDDVNGPDGQRAAARTRLHISSMSDSVSPT